MMDEALKIKPSAARYHVYRVPISYLQTNLLNFNPSMEK